MAQEPDRIRDDIELTRAELAQDVDALADRTLPNRVARRRWDDMKARARSLSGKVMGHPDGGHGMREGVGSAVATMERTASGVAEKTSEMAGDVASAVREAPHAVAERTQGSPIAVGLIAFGVGLLTASLIPPSELERRAGAQIKENADGMIGPMKQPLAESAQQIKDDMTDAATSAVDDVKQTVKQATDATKEQAKASAEDVREQTRDAVRQAR
jgi:gas vesicle protein